MSVTNDETTGRTGVCVHCGRMVEEGLLLKGLMVWQDKKHRLPKVPSPGIPTWRTLDRGASCAVCPTSPSKRHEPDPGSVREGERRHGASFGL